MPAAIAVPLISSAIAGGTAIVGAKMASNANKNASETQATSESEALKVQKEMFDRELADEQQKYQQGRADVAQSRSDLSPYRSIGQGALGLLGQGLGINVTSEPPMNVASPTTPNAGPMAQLAMPNASSQATATLSNMGIDSAHDAKGRLSEITNTLNGAQQASQSGYAAMRTPSGKAIQVPAHLVDQALAKGAQMVTA
jgi:hypothetical protein